jgi:hypothetical protein
MLPVILDGVENELGGLFREMLVEMAERLRVLDERIRQYDLRVARVFAQEAAIAWPKSKASDH